jgi:L-alanine-DL-glutamate epimerase-like enolase superfamily enzyme
VRVVAVETLRDAAHPEFLWVRVETDTGIVGLGETMPKPVAVEAAVHERLAPLLLGEEVAPEAFWTRAFQSLSYLGHAGAEMRALSAIDIALWDALARGLGAPLTTVLGGTVRSAVPVYNTCVGHGDLPDHRRFLTDPAGLARDLLGEGYRALKIYPFDAYSVESGGHGIARADLEAGVACVAAIRDAVGMELGIAIEGHSCWDLPTAIRIAEALEPYRPMWLEDMIPARTPAAWRALADATDIPICGSERVFTRAGVLPYLEAGAWRIVNQDVAWTGGITEIRKIAALVDVWELPLAPHNCHGPVAAAATVAIGLSTPNVSMVETVRSFERGIHPAVARGGHRVSDGVATLPDAPGLGVELREEFVARCTRRRTTLEDIDGAPGWGAGDPWADGVDERM